jgi:para-aminobenzoate synthetase component 1
MKHCRFEDRITGQARVLHSLCERIRASTPDELPDAFARIEQARLSGKWIALLLDYELGEWLEPALSHPLRTSTSDSEKSPRLTALVFDSMEIEKPWEILKTDYACVTSIVPELSESAYVERIEKIHHWIEQGEVYQINATFPLKIKTLGQAETLYRKIAQNHPVAFAAYIEDETRTVLSFSPELFLERRGQTLTTRPMKGTAPRATDPTEDEQLGKALQRSNKNRAENLMIVDLLRNDLGRIALAGSVRADPLFSLEKYPSVWTMTSTITADIQVGTSLEQILRALFPCGSVTGAPKIAAMQRIQQTEPSPRGLYCGSIGWLAPDGDFSLNVAIRTLVLEQNGSGVYHVGGGIVHNSDAEQEWQECFWKARVLSQDQPSLIETMRADSRGSIALLETHLDRLTNSAKALSYQCPSREHIRETIASRLDAARQDANHPCDLRVRLLLNAMGELSIETAPLPALQGTPKITTSMVILDSKNPMLRHKTTFRPWYTEATEWLSKHHDFFDQIFFNQRDEICEGSRSNIYIKKDGQWMTPALPSGLLGGAYRQHLIDTHQIKEGTLTRADLENPGAEIRLSNGLRGWFDVRFEPASFFPGNIFP